MGVGKDFPEDATEEDVAAFVQELVADPAVHGILVQLPLPKHMNEEKILHMIGKDKDVDGLHPGNVADLVMRGKEPKFVP